MSALDNISTENVSNSLNDISGAVKDPFGAVIQSSLNKINSLIVNIEKKVDQLLADVVKKTDSKGRVTLQGNTLVITVTQADVNQAAELQGNVQNKIQSIQKTLNILRNVVNSLIAINTAITVYKRLLDIQELTLTLNPATGPVFKVLKTGIKVLFLKEIINEYIKILAKQLAQNKQVLNSLLNKFRNIQVTVKIQDEANKGNFISNDESEILLADDLMGINDGNQVESDTSDFTDNNFTEYILKVEKYGEKQIIAKAYEKISGMIKAETAPSYFSTPAELTEELKSILNSAT